jgi:ribosomal protein S18 acetylase RimI-like enzyme
METRVLIPPSWSELAPLIAASREEGYLFLVRLEHEYLSGKVLFDGGGETLLGVFENSVLIALAGLTRDSESEAQSVGYVRDVYVLPKCRLRGIGKMLVVELEQRASAHFDRLVLRTGNRAAASFYERIGYEILEPDGGATHGHKLTGERTSPG